MLQDARGDGGKGGGRGRALGHRRPFMRLVPSGCTLRCQIRGLRTSWPSPEAPADGFAFQRPGPRPIAGGRGQRQAPFVLEWSSSFCYESFAMWYRELIMSAAACAYRARCQRQGGAYRLPDWGRSGIEGRHAVLRHGGSILARFKITKHAGHYRLQRAD